MNGKLLYQWREEIASHLPSLNGWQVERVSLMSMGIIEAEHCQQEVVARQVAGGEQVASAARRWRRHLADERWQQGAFVAEWVGWVVGQMAGERVYLLVDETKLGDRMGVMVIGVAFEGRCIPLAWRSYRANDHAAYPAEGQVAMIEGLLQQIQAGMPAEREVIVLADRGIGTSPDMCRAVERLGWFYLLRVTCQSKICTDSGDYTIAAMVQPGEVWAAEGRIFKKRGRLPARACALWSVDYAEPWALVTNHPDLAGAEYAHRNWQEQAFRDLKSGGWQWGDCRIRLPHHMDRLIALLALAYAWVIALGCHAVQLDLASSLVRNPDGTRRRHWSLFKEGLYFFANFARRHARFFSLSFFPDHRLP